MPNSCECKQRSQFADPALVDEPGEDAIRSVFGIAIRIELIVQVDLFVQGNARMLPKLPLQFEQGQVGIGCRGCSHDAGLIVVSFPGHIDQEIY